jgi:phosphatidylserine decarboxylase
MSVADTLRLALAPPHPAGYRLIAAGIAVFFVGLPLAAWLAWSGLLFTLFCLYFFRDPDRVPPARRGLALAPADGRVVSIATAAAPKELGLGTAPRWRVSIFLSVLNVHVNRMPVEGTVIRTAYRHGKTLNAALDKASDENERNALAVRLPDGRDVAVVQIAGLIARRIVCDVREGSVVQAGERFGIIRFGSRTDLYLPVGVLPLVAVGQTMVGGETVIAELGA